jgi:hypothetical protein
VAYCQSVRCLSPGSERDAREIVKFEQQRSSAR